MRIILLLNLILFSFNAHSQVNELESTISAVRQRIALDTSVISMLEKTWNSQSVWSIEDEILIKSVWSEALLLQDDRAAYPLAQEAIDKAIDHFGDDQHPSLGSAYIAQLFYHKRRYDYSKALEIVQKIRNVVAVEAKEFNRLAYLMAYVYCTEGKNEEAENLLERWEGWLINKNNGEKQETEFYFMAAKANYYNMVQGNILNSALANKNVHFLPVFNNRVLYDNYYQTIMLNSYLAQYYIAEIYEKKMEDLFSEIRIDGLDDILYKQRQLNYYSRLDEKMKRLTNSAEKLLAESKKYLEEAPLVVGKSYSILAEAIYQIPRRDKSLKVAEEGLQEVENYSSLLYRKAASQFHTQQYDSALVYFQKELCDSRANFNSMDLADNPWPSEGEIYEKNDVSTKDYLRWKCRALYRKALITNNKEEAIQLLQYSIEAGEASITFLNNYLEGHYQFYVNNIYYSGWNHVTRFFVMLAYYELYDKTGNEKYKRSAFTAMEGAKNQLLYKALSEPSLPPETNQFLENEIKKLDKLIRQYQLSKGTQAGEKVRLAYEQTQKLERIGDSLRQVFPNKRLGYKPLTVVTADEVQANIEPGTAVFNFKHTWDRGLVYFITTDTQMVKIFRDEKYEIWEKTIEGLTKTLGSPMQSQVFKRRKLIKDAHQIYQMILSPFIAEMHDIKKLVIIADRDLFYIPFEVLLPTDEDKPYHELDFLVKKYEISYHASASLMMKTQEKASIHNNSFLGFAPVFKDNYKLPDTERAVTTFGKMSKVVRGIDGDEFLPLIDSEYEVKGISKILGQTEQNQILLNQKATKQSLMSALSEQSYQFVHIATHGFVNFYNPTLNGLACYNESEKMGNFLYAGEVEAMDINADLVILSSCESGIGRIVEGEGLMAMSRSFFLAGAKNILFSLWKVNDEQTKNLMLNFYRNYQQQPSYSAALRQAKLKMLADPATASPRFWASFILFGE